jgi:hypothetical protein
MTCTASAAFAEAFPLDCVPVARPGEALAETAASGRTLSASPSTLCRIVDGVRTMAQLITGRCPRVRGVAVVILIAPTAAATESFVACAGRACIPTGSAAASAPGMRRRPISGGQPIPLSEERCVGSGARRTEAGALPSARLPSLLLQHVMGSACTCGPPSAGRAATGNERCATVVPFAGDLPIVSVHSASRYAVGLHGAGQRAKAGGSRADDRPLGTVSR